MVSNHKPMTAKLMRLLLTTLQLDPALRYLVFRFLITGVGRRKPAVGGAESLRGQKAALKLLHSFSNNWDINKVTHYPQIKSRQQRQEMAIDRIVEREIRCSQTNPIDRVKRTGTGQEDFKPGTSHMVWAVKSNSPQCCFGIFTFLAAQDVRD